MEVMIWVVVIWIAWMLFKGKMQRDAIREALNEIRVNALKNRKTIIETLSSSTYQTYIDGEEDIVKATIAYFSAVKLSRIAYRVYTRKYQIINLV